MGSHILLALTLLAAASYVLAADPGQVHDFCVGVNDPTIAMFVNRRFCKDTALVTGDDFYMSGLHLRGNTSNMQGSSISVASVTQIPGLNNLGVSLVRLDFCPYGLSPPLMHPQASEIIVVLEGTLYVGFVSSSPSNRLITKILSVGDVFVFPKGLAHFKQNIGPTRAYAIAAMSSQVTGVTMVADNVFGSNASISDNILSKAFQVNRIVVNLLRAPFKAGSVSRLESENQV